MSDTPETKSGLTGAAPTASAGSDMDPVIVKPGSKADPSAAPDWDEHVQEYFNEDAHPGEAVPMATHEAKE